MAVDAAVGVAVGDKTLSGVKVKVGVALKVAARAAVWVAVGKDVQVGVARTRVAVACSPTGAGVRASS